MPEHTLRVCALYPDLMNIYADRGNLTVFERRCTWRGLGFELAGAGIGDEIDPDAHDLFYLGGGQDRDQALCARDLATVKREALHAAAGRGAVVFAVCGGLQLLGHGYELEDERLPGVGLVDLDTRARGRAAAARQHRDRARPPGRAGDARGFENHAGRTYLGAGTAPLGRVLEGNGNNGRDGTEGVRGGPHGTVVGTYMHGPLLPKNTAFADWLMRTALGLGALPPLDDALEDAAHAEAARAAASQPDAATPQKRIAATAMPCAQATSSSTGTCSSAVCASRDVARPEVDGRDPGLDDERRRVAPVLHAAEPGGAAESRCSAEQRRPRPARPRRSRRAGRRRAATRPQAGARAATGRRPPRAPEPLLHLGLHAPSGRAGTRCGPRSGSAPGRRPIHSPP